MEPGTPGAPRRSEISRRISIVATRNRDTSVARDPRVSVVAVAGLVRRHRRQHHQHR